MARPRIVYITPNAVLPPNRGGRVRAHHLWRALSAYADVTPIVVGDSPGPAPRAMSRHAGATFLPRRPYRLAALDRALEGGASWPVPGLWEVKGAAALPEQVWASLGHEMALVRHCLNTRRIERIVQRLRRERPDLVVLCDTSMGLLAPFVRALGLPVVVGPHNCDSQLYASLAAAAPDEAARRWNSAASTAFAAAERSFAPHLDQLWVCSRADAQRFARHVPAGRIRIVPNVCDVGEPTPLPPSNGLVFVGQAGYFPNEDAVHRLLAISRTLDRRGLAHRLRIVGRTHPGLRRAAEACPSVEMTGEVPLVAPFLDGAALVPVPLTLGGGTRLKILEALGAARPVLSTPIGIEGIEAADGVHAAIEPDLAAFPERIAALLGDRERAQRIALEGWRLAREHYSHEALLPIVGAALRDLGLAAPKPSARAFAANMGATVRDETIVFNPHVRLLTWTFLVRLSAGHEALTATVHAPGVPDLPNAFVTLRPHRHGCVHVDATAILPAEVTPDRLSIRIAAWGRPVLRHRAPAAIPEERAGLLALEPAAGGASLLAWSSERGEELEPAGRSLDEVATGEASAVRLIRASLPLPDGTPAVAVRSPGGTGQSLAAPTAWTASRRPSTVRLRGMSGRHAGEVAWLVGNGPSVRTEDLDALAGKLTFCFNRFHLAHDRTVLRAAYTVTGDRQMIEDFGQEIVDRSGGMVFVANEEAPALVGNYVWIRQVPIFPPLFSQRADQVISPGGSSLFVAMQVGYMMGVRRFYIYGADFRFAFERSRQTGDTFRVASGEGNHFIANYRDGRPWCPPSLRDIGTGFHIARRVMEAEGGFVRNASRGGLLDMFDREPFDAALAAS